MELTTACARSVRPSSRWAASASEGAVGATPADAMGAGADDAAGADGAAGAGTGGRIPASRAASGAWRQGGATEAAGGGGRAGGSAGGE